LSGHTTTTLDLLRSGAVGQVLSVDGADDVWLRILEMGIVRGTVVTVVKFAPLGDPMELRLRGHHLSLRRAEAARIHVETRGETR
jgi:ferrous iron transport protein A